MAKKIQSNISYSCMSKSFGSAASAIYGCHAQKLHAHLHVQLTALPASPCDGRMRHQCSSVR